MFIQTQNPFSELSKMLKTPPSYLYQSKKEKTSNVWKWVIGIFALFGGICYFLWWKNKNDEAEQKKIDAEIENKETLDLQQFN